jgi:hypothetical protein
LSYLRPVGSSGDVGSRGLFLLHARTHLNKHGEMIIKKKIAPIFGVVVVTRRVVTYINLSTINLVSLMCEWISFPSGKDIILMECSKREIYVEEFLHMSILYLSNCVLALW